MVHVGYLVVEMAGEDARIKDVHLDEFLRNPDISLLINVLPQNASMSSKMNYVQILETLVSIQVTRFDCGGVVIGGVLFHKLLDGTAMSKFFNTWAKIARCDDDDGVEKITPLDFTSSSLLFPAQNLPQEFVETKNMIFFNEEKFIVKRFVFNAKSIETIKMKVSSENVPNPTRIEALPTFIWKHMILATRAAKGISSRPFMLAHLVNLRSRIDPKLPNAFGSIVFVANSEVIEISHEVELPHLVGIVREMFENMNSEGIGRR
ncbi:hypothetical protein K7X08_017152 [Anisodus acutangulus]|uniref:Uncharacterized protein n=1 Tax=Anisodus acutangulus TaxID=402998 RepID=A0A9Q1R7Y5_9SOLA|nr:hypothetical protein K7X08_017152 [Anisodus acutangulus]